VLIFKKSSVIEFMVKHFNTKRAGTRLRVLRNYLGLRRPEMGSLCGLTSERIRNLEDLKQKMNEQDLEIFCSSWPFAIDYLITGGALRLDPTESRIINVINQVLIENPTYHQQASAIVDICEPGKHNTMAHAAVSIPCVQKEAGIILKAIMVETTKGAKADAR